MPVTAKLSRALYDKLGDHVADELVDWFNMVDATYRADLRELNELNFARFDAKLEQRLAELRTELRAEMQAGFARLDARIDQLTLHADGRIDQLTSQMHARMAKLETRLTKRLFGFWIAQAVATACLVLGIAKLIH
ncbi:MAG TPA: hypothetical protein VLV45_11820 [Gemmatimonadales bacterium]|nr:hypothetical protein [Gemmatimonadales bacterium]